MDENKVVLTHRPDDSSIGRPDVQIVSMQWWSQSLIRGARVYLQSLVGFLLATGSGAAAAVGVNMSASDFGHVLLASASLALAPAVIALLQNAIEILSRLDVTTPQLRA